MASGEDSTQDSADSVGFFSDSLYSLFGVHSPARGDPGATLAYTHPLLPRGADGHDSIKFEIPDHDGVNTKLFAHLQWDAGWELSNQIVLSSSSHAQTPSWADVRDKSCLEVGAGTGLPSLVAARMGAHGVVVTDYPDEGILANIRRNVARQPLAPGVPSAMQVAGLSWGEPSHEKAVLAQSPSQKGFDLVIAADTLWISSTHSLLLHSLLTLVARHGRVLVAAGFHSGYPAVRRFFELCERGIKGLGKLVPDETAVPAEGAESCLTTIAGIWKKNTPTGEIAPWEPRRQLQDEGREDDMGSIEERAKWCVMACLKWMPLDESYKHDDSRQTSRHDAYPPAHRGQDHPHTLAHAMAGAKPLDHLPSSSSTSATMGSKSGLSLIVALSPTNGIGLNGGLPWSLKREMAYFRRATTFVPAEEHARGARNAVIMGRTTWESIPAKFRPLKGRINVVVSRTIGADREQALGIDSAQDAYLVSSVEDAASKLSEISTPVARKFLIGGSQLYSQALAATATSSGKPSAVDQMLITRILSPGFDCDVFLPEFRTEEQIAADASAASAARGSDSPSPRSGQQPLETRRWVKQHPDELADFLGPDGVERGTVQEGDVSYEFQMWRLSAQ